MCERKSGVGQGGEVEEVWLQGQALRITAPLLHLSYPPPLFPPLASPPYFFASLLIPGVSLCSPLHAAIGVWNVHRLYDTLHKFISKLYYKASHQDEP